MRTRSLSVIARLAMLAMVWLAVQPSAQTQGKVRLGLFTAKPTKWELDQNWETFQRTFLAHRDENIDLVVTPECFLDGYVASAKDWTSARFVQIAQDVATSPYIARVRAMAEKYKTAILFGFYRKGR